MKRKRYYKFFLIILLGCAGCQTDTACRKSMEAQMQITFSSAVDSVTVIGIGIDSILINNQKDVLSLNLPLRPDSCRTAYAINRNDTIDTLTVWHNNDRLYVSLACGCAILHTIDSVNVTRHWITDLVVVNSTIETTLQENLTIYAD
mgnify:CR=1 FL=1